MLASEMALLNVPFKHMGMTFDGYHLLGALNQLALMFSLTLEAIVTGYSFEPFDSLIIGLELVAKNAFDRLGVYDVHDICCFLIVLSHAVLKTDVGRIVHPIFIAKKLGLLYFAADALDRSHKLCLFGLLVQDLAWGFFAGRALKSSYLGFLLFETLYIHHIFLNLSAALYFIVLILRHQLITLRRQLLLCEVCLSAIVTFHSRICNLECLLGGLVSKDNARLLYLGS